MNTIETIKKKEIFRGKYTRIYSDTVRFPSGEIDEYLYIERPTSVAIVPLFLKENKLYTVMVQQHRYPINRAPYQFAMGMTEDEDTLKDARRELIEETGMEAGHIEEIAYFYHDPGVNMQKTKLFVAVNPRESKKPKADDSERVTSVLIEVTEFPNMIKQGLICDALTIAIVHLIEDYIYNHKELI